MTFERVPQFHLYLELKSIRYESGYATSSFYGPMQGPLPENTVDRTLGDALKGILETENGL